MLEISDILLQKWFLVCSNLLKRLIALEAIDLGPLSKRTILSTLDAFFYTCWQIMPTGLFSLLL